MLFNLHVMTFIHKLSNLTTSLTLILSGVKDFINKLVERTIDHTVKDKEVI